MQTLSINLADIQRQFPRSAVYDLRWVMVFHLKSSEEKL